MNTDAPDPNEPQPSSGSLEGLANVLLVVAAVELVGAFVLVILTRVGATPGKGANIGFGVAVFAAMFSGVGCVLAFVARLVGRQPGLAVPALVLAAPLVVLAGGLLALVAWGIAEEP